MIASLPMYPVFPEAVGALWQAIADRLRPAGFAEIPAGLVWPSDVVAHWRRSDLVLSQTCGYPLLKELDDAVRVVGAFRYSAPGCDGVSYRSMVIARSDDAGKALADFRGRRAAINSPGSQSGYNCFRALVAPLARDGHFFEDVVETGSHGASMRAIADGAADIAAIDCISFAQFCAADPALARSLKVVAQTASVPGLPLITHAAASDADVALLRAVLADVVADPALSSVLATLMIDGFEPIEAEAYARILEMEQAAIAAGYPVLG